MPMLASSSLQQKGPLAALFSSQSPTLQEDDSEILGPFLAFLFTAYSTLDDLLKTAWHNLAQMTWPANSAMVSFICMFVSSVKAVKAAVNTQKWLAQFRPR